MDATSIRLAPHPHRGRSACSRRFCSPTSSARPSWRRASATRRGERCSSGTTRSCAASSRGSRGGSSTPPVTAFFAAFDGPARAVQAAFAIRDALRALDLEIRAGLHTGECEVSDGKIAGIAVSIGARISSVAAPGEVLVSSTVKDLVAGPGSSSRTAATPAQGHSGGMAALRGGRSSDSSTARARPRARASTTWSVFAMRPDGCRLHHLLG